MAKTAIRVAPEAEETPEATETNVPHATLRPGVESGIHVIQAWEVADQAERLGLLLVPEDEGKVCRQLDDDSYWLLALVSPLTWMPFGGVTSVFGRAGPDVVAADNDYDSDQIENISSVTGASLTDALEALEAAIAAVVVPVQSVFGRGGDVLATLGDYTSSLVSNVSAVAGATVSAALDVLASAISSLSTTVTGLGASKADNATTFTAGAGLGGGGDLSANRNFDVLPHADGSIAVGPDSVGVGVLATDAQHGARGGGTQHAAATGTAAGFMTVAQVNALAQAEADIDALELGLSAGGDVHGPAAANDNALARFDGDGKHVQGSPIGISDTGAITGAASLDVTGNITVGGLVDGVDVSALAAAVGGKGDVVGPASATDERIARFDGATGKLVQSSVVGVSDAGAITGATSLDVTGNIVVSGLVDGVDVSALATTVSTKAAGPASATDERVARFDGASGKLLQDSAVAISDAGNVTGVASLTVTGNITVGGTVDGVDISQLALGSGKLQYTWVVDDYADLATVTPVPGPGDEGKLALVRYSGTDQVGNTILDNSTFYYVKEVTEPTAGHLWRNMTTRDVDARVTMLEETGPGGTGDVVGPTSATDNAVTRFDATTGKLVQSSLVTIDDSGNIATPGLVDGVDVSTLSTTVSGKVAGPASSTLNAVARYADTTGKLAKNSGVTVDDSNNLAGIATATCVNLTVNGSITVTGNVDGVDVSTLNTTVTGKMTGAAASNLNALVKFGDTTGKLAKSGGAVLLDDSANLSGLASLTTSTLTVNGAITVSGTVDGVDVSSLNTTVTNQQTSINNLTSRPYLTIGTDAVLSAERALQQGDSIWIADSGSVATVNFRPLSILIQSGLTLSPVSHPNGSLLNCSNVAGDLVWTLQTNAVSPFPLGTFLRIARIGGAGKLTVSPAGGVTVYNHTGSTAWIGAFTLYHYNFTVLHKVDTDVWFNHGVCGQ